MADQFEKKASTWDELPWKEEMAQKVYNTISRTLSLNKDFHLLDFGGGTGILSLKFQQDVKKITVVDTSKAMLSVLKEKMDKLNLHHVEIIEDEIQDAKIKAASLDLIISMMTLHHISDLLPLFKSFKGLLKPGGHIALIDLEKEAGDFHPKDAIYVHNGFESQEIKNPLEKAGFQNINISTVYTISKKTDAGVQKNFPTFLVSAHV